MSTAVKKFVFGPFMENTYVLHDESKECVIIDPGCFDQYECKELQSFIDENGLKPVRMLLTHSHLDHIMGCHFVKKTWNLVPEVHPKDEMVYRSFESSCLLFQIPGAPTPPDPQYSIREGEDIEFGNTRLKVHFVPGHSPGHVTYECMDENFLIAGDVLFQRSIGRTDLPGGNHETLIRSIKEVLMNLDLERVVYCGHGPETTLREEQKFNPFLQ